MIFFVVIEHWEFAKTTSLKNVAQRTSQFLQTDVWSSSYDYLRSLRRWVARSLDCSIARLCDRSIATSLDRSIALVLSGLVHFFICSGPGGWNRSGFHLFLYGLVQVLFFQGRV